MTAPRRVVPGTTYMVTRRCSQRSLFLTPTRETKRTTTYFVAFAVERYGMELHAATWLGSHYHMVLTDPAGRLPDFQRDLDSLVARALNARLGRGESFWAPNTYSSVELPDEAAVLDALVYVITNATKDGLVSHPSKWPGFRTLARELGRRSIRARRPEGPFFQGRSPRAGRARPRRTSTLPQVARCRLTLPPLFAQRDVGEFAEMLGAAVEERVAEIRRERGKRPFLGVHAILSADPLSSAGDAFPSFSVNPRIAPGKPRPVRIARLRELKGWRADYRQARQRWRVGERAVLFPHGTFLLRVAHGALVKPPPDPSALAA